MRVLELFHHGNVVQLDVQVLVHALQRALELNVVLELDGDLLVDERFEEADRNALAPASTQRIPLPWR